MAMMLAGLVRSFDAPPRYERWSLAEPTGPHEATATVLAAGLHPRVRAGAAGQHHSSVPDLPFVPGIDGVGRLPSGELVYFVTPEGGSMAERTVVDLRTTVPLSEGSDAAVVAATLNPAMSAWVALRARVSLVAGQSVLVLGATGNAGGMAVRIAKLLGAGRVVAAGRNRQRLDELRDAGADLTVSLADDRAATAASLAAAADVDIVLDYLWGDPAADAMMAMLTARRDRSRLLEWVQIGSAAGPTLALPSVALRSANLKIQGNGQGAVSTQAYVAQLPSLVAVIDAGAIGIAARRVPLSEIESAWSAGEQAGVRTVFVP